MTKSNHNPKAKVLINKYIKKSPEFSHPICNKLRELILKADPDIIEDWKWGPNYQKNGMVCGFGAFKQHVTLTFFQGAILKDPKKILNHGTTNQHNRNIKFKSINDIDEDTLIKYIREAVNNNVKEIKSKDKTVIIPEELIKALEVVSLLEIFEATSYTNRKEFVNWIESAKKQETISKRLKATIEMISRGEKFS